MKKIDTDSLSASRAATLKAQQNLDRIADLIEQRRQAAAAIRAQIDAANAAVTAALAVVGQCLADEADGRGDPKAIQTARQAAADAQGRAGQARLREGEAVEADATAQALAPRLEAAEKALAAAKNTEARRRAEVVAAVGLAAIEAYEQAAAGVITAFADVTAISSFLDRETGKEHSLLPVQAMGIRLPTLRGKERDILTRSSYAEATAAAVERLTTTLARAGIAA